MPTVSLPCSADWSPDAPPAQMRRKPVESSSLASVGYDKATRTLEVEFRKGRLYRYHEVGAEIYERLMTADSKGRFMNAHIRTAYRFTRVR
jgi:hypothetical protein